MSIIDPSYFDVPKKKRPVLEALFEEYEVLKKIEASITQYELWDFLNEIYQREAGIAAEPLLPLLSQANVPEAYATAWVQAFLETIIHYRDNAHNYADIVRYFDLFDQKVALQFKHVDPPTQNMSPADELSHWFSKDIDAQTLGSKEAHEQIRRITQLYYGRYSWDRRDISRKPPGTKVKDDISRHDQHSFTHRQNICAKLKRNHDIFDPTVGLTLYIDHLKSRSSNLFLPTWWSHTRPLYERERLLMPGLEKTANVLRRIEVAYRGNFSEALRNFEATIHQDRERYDIALLFGYSSLCTINVMRGRVLVGDRKFIAPDVHPQSEIDFNGKAVIHAWKAESTDIRNRAVSLSARAMARIAKAEEKLKRAMEELYAAKHAVTKRSEAKALQSRLAEERRRIKEEARKKHKEDAKAAKEKARETIQTKREKLRKRQEKKELAKEEAEQQEKKARAQGVSAPKAFVQRNPVKSEKTERKPFDEREKLRRQTEREVRKAVRDFRNRKPQRPDDTKPTTDGQPTPPVPKS